MKRPVPVESSSALIDEKIKELGDWRGKTLAKVREIIREADPEIVEEWKWRKESSPGTPVWSQRNSQGLWIRATMRWQDQLQEGDEVVGAIRNPR
jgi:hypothetical protein